MAAGRSTPEGILGLNGGAGTTLKRPPPPLRRIVWRAAGLEVAIVASKALRRGRLLLLLWSAWRRGEAPHRLSIRENRYR